MFNSIDRIIRGYSSFVVNNITSIISTQLNMDIRSFHLDTSEGVTNTTIMLYVNDLSSLNELIAKLKKIKQIKKVRRLDRFTDQRIN